MDIKEKFYANLEQIREDYDPGAKEAKRKNDKYIKRRNKHGLKSDNWNEKSKLINKKAVTGLDEEQLDEISGAKARKSEHASAEVYHRAYDDETRARRKAIKDKTPESKEAAEKAKDKREKAAKRTIRFQNYADKKEKELGKDQLNELKDATHMSYRAKARNQIDKMVNNLGNKMMSNYVNTKKLKNRADGIQKSYKLQPGLKKKNK